MSSSVFVKFKSQKEPSRVTFDGTGISVFDLKREIITINHLGDGNDFELAIYNEDTNEEYDDDTTIIPRSTSIIAKRLPAIRAGKGGAARYVSGKAPLSAKNSSRAEKTAAKPTRKPSPLATSQAVADMNGAQTEEERIAAMLKAGEAQWEAQKKEMANQKPVYRSGPKGKPHTSSAPENVPPPGYICYRCGEKGHWIQDCPTNDDPNFDGRPRVKRTTGIPRSFLKTIAKPVSLSNDGLTDMSKQPSGVMVNAEGEFVVAEPDKASWEQFQARNKASEVAQQIADKGSEELQDRGLECSIDKRMFVEPTKTPCCGQTYCNDCITNALIEGDLVCPNCQKEGILLDDLVPDHEVAAKIKAYRAEKEEQRSREASKSRSGSPKPKGTLPENGETLARTTDNLTNAGSKPEETSKNDESPKLAENTTKNESPKPGKGPNRSSTSTPAADSTTSTGSKKRAASDDLENLRIPKAPAAMRNMIQQQAQAAHRYAPTNYNGGYNSNTPYQPQAAGHNNFYAQGMNPMVMSGGGGNFMGMPSTMGGMMGMDPSMMNPMMGFGGMFNGVNGVNGMSGMNGMGGVPNMPMMNMYAPFNNNNAGMMANSMGYPSMPMSMPMGNASSGMGMNGNSYPAAGMPQQHLHNNNAQANFPNQQRSVGSGFVGSGNGIGGVMGGAPQAEEGAYFRQPVNPNRHQSKNRRVRPSDYHEV